VVSTRLFAVTQMIDIETSATGLSRNGTRGLHKLQKGTHTYIYRLYLGKTYAIKRYFMCTKYSIISSIRASVH